MYVSAVVVCGTGSVGVSLVHPRALHACQRLSIAPTTSSQGTVTEKVRELQSSVDSLQARMANLCFDYADPEPRFDRRKVHGLVARLIRVPDAKFSTGMPMDIFLSLLPLVLYEDIIPCLTLTPSRLLTNTALEVAAGGRLYNVIVDSQNTGAKLLKNVCSGRMRETGSCDLLHRRPRLRSLTLLIPVLT